MSELAPLAAEHLPEPVANTEISPREKGVAAQAKELWYIERKRPKKLKRLLEEAHARSKCLVELDGSELVLDSVLGKSPGTFGVFTNQDYFDQLQVVRLLSGEHERPSRSPLIRLTWIKTMLGAPATASALTAGEIYLNAGNLVIGLTVIVGAVSTGVGTWAHIESNTEDAYRRIQNARGYLEQFRDRKPDLQLSPHNIYLPSEGDLLSPYSEWDFEDNIDAVLTHRGIQPTITDSLALEVAKASREGDRIIPLGTLHVLELLISSNPKTDLTTYIQPEMDFFDTTAKEAKKLREAIAVINSSSDFDNASAETRAVLENLEEERRTRGIEICRRVIATYNRERLNLKLTEFKTNTLPKLTKELDVNAAEAVRDFTLHLFEIVEELRDAHPIIGPREAISVFVDVCSAVERLCSSQDSQAITHYIAAVHEELDKSIHQANTTLSEETSPQPSLAPTYEIYPSDTEPTEVRDTSLR